MKTLGLRHVALNVKDPQVSKDFYIRIMKMKVEWEPDRDNIYLTNDSQDNLALHRSQKTTDPKSQTLDHIGFMLRTPEDVDHWYAWIQSQHVKIVKEIKTHRDGAKSFYMADPDGIIIQIIYHPPIAQKFTSNLL